MERQSLYILTGASKGLGEALKNHLVQLPNTMVIGVSRSPIKAERNFIPLQIDLADTDELISKIPEIFPSEDFDKVVLINNEFSGLSKFQSFKDNGELSTPDEVAKKVLFLINNPSDFDGVLQDVRKF